MAEHESQLAFFADARRALAYGGSEQTGDDCTGPGGTPVAWNPTEMTQQAAQTAAYSPRRERLRRALFRGESLHLGNREYLKAARTLLDELLGSDVGSGDLTVAALQLADEHAGAKILAKEAVVIAGLAEFCWLLNRNDVEVKVCKQDGEAIDAGDVILEIEGRRSDLLAQERVGLNILQRLSGIATATRRFQELVHRRNPDAHVVATRKTPWGLLDAILVKNNHLALLANREEEAVHIAVERAWPARQSAAFIEVEVRSELAALAAAQAFR